MSNLIILLAIVFGIFQLILFFKIWGMTNDVAGIYGIMKNKTVLYNHDEAKFSIGDHLIIKSTNKKIIVNNIECDNGIFYYSEDKLSIDRYREDDLELLYHG